MAKSLLFFDIDGTLMSEKTHIISQNTLNALKKAQENGHLIIINTGRPYSTISPQIKSIHYDGIICGCGTYIELNNKVIFHHSIDPKLCHTVIEKLKTYHMYGLLEGKEAVYFDKDNTFLHIEEIKQNYAKDRIETHHTWQEDVVCFDKMSIWEDEKSEANQFYQFASQYFHFIKRDKNFNECIPLGFSKATGIEYILNYLNVSYHHSYCFGDSMNDLEMLNYVQHSIAMANSPQEVLAAVEFVTKDVDDNGIEYALKHYHLI